MHTYNMTWSKNYRVTESYVDLLLNIGIIGTARMKATDLILNMGISTE